MSFTKVAPAGIGTEPGDGYRIGNSFLHATGLNVSGIVTATQGGTVTYYGDGSNLTGIDATAIKHTNGDVKVQATATGVNITGNLGVSGVLTYEDVTNIDSVGVITARSGIKIGPTAGVAGTFFADGSYVTAGIITATTFHGSGANLTGISGVSVANQADNRLITATGTTDALNGETNLTFDGSQLVVKGADTATGSGGAKAISLRQGDANGEFVNLAFETGAGGPIAVISGIADATGVYPNTTGSLSFNTQVGGGVFERLRIASGGDVSIGGMDSNSFSNYRTLTIGGAGAVDGSGIDLERSDGTIYGRLFGDANGLQIGAPASGDYIRFETQNTERVRIDSSGHVLPGANNQYDLGSSSNRWRNVYTTDLQLSNKGKTNDVDNTWGDYTIQEGESDLFLINNRSGKKYKFNLTEVS